jgi:hypothetical protein
MTGEQRDILRSERRKAVDTKALYERIEHRLHTMHLTPRKASLLAGLPPDGVRTIARGRIPRADKLQALAKIMDVDMNWFGLNPGEDALDRAINEKQAELSLLVNRNVTPLGPMLPSKQVSGHEMTRIAEIDARTAQGGNLSAAAPMAEWGMPRGFVDQLLPAGGDQLRVVAQAGDAMAPTVQPGQRLVVNTDDRTPSPPGLFATWDGLAVTIRRLEYLPLSRMVRVSADNPRYSTVETEPANVNVLGRVVLAMQPM